MKVFDRLMQYLDGRFALEQAPRQEGKNITMVVAPK
jgi:translation initiation factor IF-3